MLETYGVFARRQCGGRPWVSRKFTPRDGSDRVRRDAVVHVRQGWQGATVAAEGLVRVAMGQGIPYKKETMARMTASRLQVRCRNCICRCFPSTESELTSG